MVTTCARGLYLRCSDAPPAAWLRSPLMGQLKKIVTAGCILCAIATVPPRIVAQATHPNAAHKTANVLLTISISAPITEASYGSQIEIDFKLINRTDHPIDCGGEWSESGNDSYPFEITNVMGKKILPRQGGMLASSAHGCTLDPGATKSWEAALNPTAYPGLVPGEYRIRVSAQNPGNPGGERLYSNTVTIKIDAPPARPAGNPNPDEGQPKLPVKLILSPEHILVTSDSNFTLAVKVMNQSQKRMWCIGGLDTSGVDDNFKYDIRWSDGKPVQRVRKIGQPYPPGPPCTVLPGEDFDTGLPGLMDAFDMRQPGVYTVQVSLPDPDHPGQMLATSNVVTVTVKALQ